MEIKIRQIINTTLSILSKIRSHQRGNLANSNNDQRRIKELKSKITFELLPGQGFFGSHQSLALTIPINTEITQLEIAVEAPKKQMLNLDQIDLIDPDGKPLDKLKAIAEAELSSHYKDKSNVELLRCIQTGRGTIRSNKESRPSLKIKLSKGHYIQSLTIKNRNDENGRRSQFLVVNAFKDNKKVSQYINFSKEKGNELIDELCNASSISIEDGGIHENIFSITKKLKTGIKVAIENGSLDWDAKKLIQLLPVYEKKPQVSDFHEYIVSIVLLKLLGTGGYIPTKSLMPLASILKRHTTIERILNQASSLSEKVTNIDSIIVLSKHSLNRSRLRQ